MKELDKIYNNQLFNYILTTKGITKEIFEKEKETIKEYYNVLKSYDLNNNISLIETLLYLYLNKSLEILDNNIQDIKINNNFKINQNTFNTNIGNIVLLDNKKVAIFLGTFPNNVEINKNISNNNYILEINFIENIPYFYSFDDNKIISGINIWWKSFENQEKIKTYIKKVLSKEKIEEIIK